MKIFLAGDCYPEQCYKAVYDMSDVKAVVKADPENYILPLKKLYSFAYESMFNKAKPYLSHLKDMLVDSGAFTFRLRGDKDVDFKEICYHYSDFINRNDIKQFFEMDVDALVGYEQVLKYRELIEKETGKKVIPVWHKSRGIQEFFKMCSEYSYVAVGGTASVNEIRRTEWPALLPFLINESHKRGAKIHGLGFTSFSQLKKYHFDSVDSATWISGSRFGTLFKFTGSGVGMTSIRAPVGYRAIREKIHIHDFIEWVKYSEWAEAHL